MQFLSVRPVVSFIGHGAGVREVDRDVQLIYSCADGTSILTTSEDRTIRIFDTLVVLHQSQVGLSMSCDGADQTRPHEFTPDLFRSHRSFAQPDAIHSTAWYPTASAAHPETFVLLASVRDGSVRMIDAMDGRVSSLFCRQIFSAVVVVYSIPDTQIRATYPIVDHRERFIAPHSMAFNPSATK